MENYIVNRFLFQCFKIKISDEKKKSQIITVQATIP